MFDFLRRPKRINTTQVVDEIENAVYAHLKPLGFRKHGRTLHRFVSEDISQVIHFQSGVRSLEGFLCVNLGVRIPECAEGRFHAQGERKKYYRGDECTLRSRLGTVSGKNETWFDLRKNTNKLIKSIITEIDGIVIPAFDVLNSREAILAHWREYAPRFYGMRLLEECMIYGHWGDLEKAKELFELYYQSAVDCYNDMVQNGSRIYARKGERIVTIEDDITVEEDGYITLYGTHHAYHRHIDYLDNLAVELGIR